MKIREIPASVVFALGDKYESFTLYGGLYIPMGGFGIPATRYFRRDLDTVLRNWIIQDGPLAGHTNDRYANAIRSRIYEDQNSEGNTGQNE